MGNEVPYKIPLKGIHGTLMPSFGTKNQGVEGPRTRGLRNLSPAT